MLIVKTVFELSAAQGERHKVIDILSRLWKREVIDLSNYFCISTNFCGVSGQQWSSLSVKATTIISIIEKLLTGTDTFPVIKSAEMRCTLYSFRIVKANFTGTYRKYSLEMFSFL